LTRQFAVTLTTQRIADLTIGTIALIARRIDASFWCADTPLFTGISQLFAAVFMAYAIDAYLAICTLYGGTGIGHTKPSSTPLFRFAINAGTAFFTNTCATNLCGITTVLVASIGNTATISTEITLFARAQQIARCNFAMPLYAELCIGTLAVKATGRSIEALTALTPLGGIWTPDVATEVVVTTILPTDATVFAGTTGDAAILCALPLNTDLTGFTTHTCTRICFTDTIAADLTATASHPCTHRHTSPFATELT
jgi:hypothetical protein